MLDSQRLGKDKRPNRHGKMRYIHPKELGISKVHWKPSNGSFSTVDLYKSRKGERQHFRSGPSGALGGCEIFIFRPTDDSPILRFRASLSPEHYARTVD